MGLHGAGDEFAGRLRARKVDAILRLGIPMMVANIVNAWAFILVLALEDQSRPVALAWASGLTLMSGWWLVVALRRRGRTAPPVTSARTIRRMIRSAAIFGVVWAIPGATFFAGLGGFSIAFGAALITGMVCGGAIALYPIPAAAMAFLLPIVASATASVAWTFGIVAVGPAIIAAMFVVLFHMVIRRNAALFDAEFRLRLELERRNRLIEDLLDDARLEVVGSRRLSEERLAQAKKMEAIGQLTSGIAHDFNNLLAAVRGNAELLADDGRYDADLVEAILKVSERGARQVQRLLSIAQKQFLQPEPVGLPALLADVQRILQPTFGPDHPVHVRVAPGTPPVLADPAQLENGVINLAFNARDALPAGGEIVIDCAAADVAGQVDVTVIDRGVGMDAETLERALDPFYTTKPFGQGNGLGLSSVAGFARQSGGEVLIDSIRGQGTRVTLRLPAATAADSGDDAPATPERRAPARARLLVVEDMPEVLAVTRKMLEGLGYAVTGVTRADAAIAHLEAGTGCDLVLTDILLADSMTGLELARTLHRTRPGLPVIFMSAWSKSAVSEATDLAGALLQKPFSREELGRHVAKALGAARAAGGPVRVEAG